MILACSGSGTNFIHRVVKKCSFSETVLKNALTNPGGAAIIGLCYAALRHHRKQVEKTWTVPGYWELAVHSFADVGLRLD